MDQASYGTNLPERLMSPLSAWREALKGFSHSLRVALPGTIVSFNAAKQTVVAQPAIKELTRLAGVLTIESLPELLDVPVLLPRSGGFTLTMPIQAGDECLIVFSDQAIDSWFQAGGTQNPVSPRRHSLSDGFAFVGLWNQQRVLTNYSTSSAQLRSDNGQTVIDLAAGQVTVTAQTVNVQASGTATVQGATVNVTGSNAVHISGAGQTFLEGRNFLNHSHSGVASGNATSGPVV